MPDGYILVSVTVIFGVYWKMRQPCEEESWADSMSIYPNCLDFSDYSDCSYGYVWIGSFNFFGVDPDMGISLVFCRDSILSFLRL